MTEQESITERFCGWYNCTLVCVYWEFIVGLSNKKYKMNILFRHTDMINIQKI